MPISDMSNHVRTLARAAMGTRRDWTLPSPAIPRPSNGLQLVGPAAVLASVAVAWFAFASAGGSTALGLYLGAVSILLMAWSFLLALRIPQIEPLFGGLDSMYKVHRWAGSLAVIAMFWHVRIEPEVDGGIRGASKAIAEAAEELAGIAEYMLYGLVAVSLVRWFPYRWWRLTHKALGIPFAFASWHFFTAEKTYANGSPWGWYFGLFMVAGLVAYLARVVGRDMFAQGTRYRVTETLTVGSTTELRLAPIGRKMHHEVGQFAVIKLQHPGLREPHVFTIASAPHEEELRFFIRDLGDWTAKVQAADLVGVDAFVEGPYGSFEPNPETDAATWWIAGGVGITPFLSATNARTTAHDRRRPRLVYCVSDRSNATALHELEAAAADGRVDLEVFASEEGDRFSPERFAELAGPGGLAGAHVAICGPQGLVTEMRRTAMELGASAVETEAFDIRSGVGPDLSRQFSRLSGQPNRP